MRSSEPTWQVEATSADDAEARVEVESAPSPKGRGWVLAAAVGVTALVFGYLFTLSGDSSDSQDVSAPAMASATVETTYVPPATTTTLFAPDDGLVAHLTFDDPAVERGGGQGVQPTSDRFGRPNRAYVFNGESDHVAASVSAEQLDGPLTLAAWVRLDTSERESSEWSSVVSLGEGGPVLALDGAGDPAGGLHHERCRFSGSTEVRDGAWHHLAMTRDAGGTIRVYLDGAGQLLINDSPGRGGAQMAAVVQPCSIDPVVGDATFWIGGAPGIGQHFAGAIDDVRIYDRAIPPAGIRALFGE